MKILQPPDWVRPKGYANGVTARGDMVFLSGMVGWNAEGKFEARDPGKLAWSIARSSAGTTPL